MIIEVEQFDKQDIPENYTWMTLSQIREFQQVGLFNSDARNLISIINLL